VKITGAHDFNDYEVAKRNDIPMYSLMDERGAMCESEIIPAKYVGMDRFKARKEVVKDIDAEGLLIKIEDKKIMQPYGDRSGVVIEPMLTDQWFVAADKLAGEAMDAVARGHSHTPPENWKKTYDHWMKDIQPWCISRQLWWGHQIPAWYGPELDDGISNTGGQVRFVAETEAEALVLAREHYSKSYIGSLKVEVHDDSKVRSRDTIEFLSFSNLPQGFFSGLDPKAINSSCEIKIWRDPDVLDTWFSSGLWPFSVCISWMRCRLRMSISTRLCLMRRARKCPNPSAIRSTRSI